MSQPLGKRQIHRRSSINATARDGSIEAGLFLLAAITPRGKPLTQEEIAFVCGCSQANIYQAEKSALEKLRRSGLARRLREAI